LNAVEALERRTRAPAKYTDKEENVFRPTSIL
jgi:hypothetical protein